MGVTVGVRVRVRARVRLSSYLARVRDWQLLWGFGFG